MPVLLPHGIERNKIVEKLKIKNIQTTMHYPAPWSFTAYKNDFPKSKTPFSTEIIHREITLPLHTLMTQKDAEKVCIELKKVI